MQSPPAGRVQTQLPLLSAHERGRPAAASSAVSKWHRLARRLRAELKLETAAPPRLPAAPLRPGRADSPGCLRCTCVSPAVPAPGAGPERARGRGPSLVPSGHAASGGHCRKRLGGWRLPVLPVVWEAEAGRPPGGAHPGQLSGLPRCCLKIKHEKRAGEAAQCGGPGFHPSTSLKVGEPWGTPESLSIWAHPACVAIPPGEQGFLA